MFKALSPIKEMFAAFAFFHIFGAIEVIALNIFKYNANLFQYCIISIVLGFVYLYIYRKMLKEEAK